MLTGDSAGVRQSQIGGVRYGPCDAAVAVAVAIGQGAGTGQVGSCLAQNFHSSRGRARSLAMMRSAGLAVQVPNKSLTKALHACLGPLGQPGCATLWRQQGPGLHAFAFTASCWHRRGQQRRREGRMCTRLRAAGAGPVDLPA